MLGFHHVYKFEGGVSTFLCVRNDMERDMVQFAQTALHSFSFISEMSVYPKFLPMLDKQDGRWALTPFQYIYDLYPHSFPHSFLWIQISEVVKVQEYCMAT